MYKHLEMEQLPSILVCQLFQILSTKKNGGSDYDDKVTFLFSIIVYLSLAQCLVMTFLAKPIIVILYGSDFIKSAEVLRIGVWYTTFSYVGAVRSVWILAENKQKYLWIQKRIEQLVFLPSKSKMT